MPERASDVPNEMNVEGDTVVFFDSPEGFRAWLAEHHETRDVQWVGYWKKATGRPSMTWEESVRQALCFGWIDGLRRSIDDEAYRIRFTPRRPGSHWSRKNVEMYRELDADGQIEAAGVEAWERRDPEKTGRASYEREKPARLPDELRARFDANPDAAAWFADQAPGYRRTCIHWIMSAKRAETRKRRLEQLIEDSAAGRRIGPLRR